MDLEIIKIAANNINNKHINNCTHQIKHKNPLCGDKIEINLTIKDDKIEDFAYQCDACIYCQASVSLLSRKTIKNSLDKLSELVEFSLSFFDNKNSKFPKKWDNFNKLFKEKNLNRKECLLLPFKAVSKILKKI